MEALRGDLKSLQNMGEESPEELTKAEVQPVESKTPEETPEIEAKSIEEKPEEAPKSDIVVLAPVEDKTHEETIEKEVQPIEEIPKTEVQPVEEKPVTEPKTKETAPIGKEPIPEIIKPVTLPSKPELHFPLRNKPIEKTIEKSKEKELSFFQSPLPKFQPLSPKTETNNIETGLRRPPLLTRRSKILLGVIVGGLEIIILTYFYFIPMFF